LDRARFDSDACFAALLGTPEHGRWLIAPQDGQARVTRRYRPNTLILETRFESAEGVATLVDFMPVHQSGSSVVRLIIGEFGHIAMKTELVIRFGFGATVPWMMRLDEGPVQDWGSQSTFPIAMHQSDWSEQWRPQPL